MAFTREQTVAVATGNGQVLSVEDLPNDPEPAESGWPIEVEDCREVLGPALFDPGPAGTVVFRHQRYPEFLAAAYLVSRGGFPEQIADLVGVRANGALPTSMINIVA